MLKCGICNKELPIIAVDGGKELSIILHKMAHYRESMCNMADLLGQMLDANAIHGLFEDRAKTELAKVIKVVKND